VASSPLRIIFVGLFLAPFSLGFAQENHPAVDQARLFQSTPSAKPVAVDANGTALADSDSYSEDDSLGAQAILKNNVKIPTLFFSADTSLFYTSNAALTRRNETSDEFFVTYAAASWTPHIAPGIEGQVGAHASIFRYDRLSALDFEDLGAGAGVTWTPRNLSGVALFARYDFTELLDRHSDEILSDHQFSFGAQKTIPISRAQTFFTGLLASAGISDPHSDQRDQLSVFVGYHCVLTRSIDADLSYRASFYRYNHDGRADINQAVAANVRYHFNELLEADVFLTFADNRSNSSAFDYGVFTCGGGVGLRLRF